MSSFTGAAMYLKTGYGEGALVESYVMLNLWPGKFIFNFWSSNKTDPNGNFIDKGVWRKGTKVLYKISGGNRNEKKFISYNIATITDRTETDVQQKPLLFPKWKTQYMLSTYGRNTTFPRSNATNGYIKAATVTATDLSSGEVLATTTTNGEGEYAFALLNGLPEYVLIRLSQKTHRCDLC